MTLEFLGENLTVIGDVKIGVKKREKDNITKKPEPKPPGGKPPEDKSQYNFTDPESRIMKPVTASILNRHITLRLR